MNQQKTLKLITFAKLANVASAFLSAGIALTFYLINSTGNFGVLVLYILGFIIIPAGILTALVATVAASLACNLFAAGQTKHIALHPMNWQLLAIAGSCLIGVYVSVFGTSPDMGSYFTMSFPVMSVLAPIIFYAFVTFVSGMLAASKITTPIRAATLLGIASSSFSFLIIFYSFEIILPHIVTALALAVPLLNSLALARLEYWMKNPGAAFRY